MASPTVTVHLFASVGRDEQIHHIADLEFDLAPGETAHDVVQDLVDVFNEENDDA